MNHEDRLIYRPVFAIDVEQYSVRDARQQLTVQRDLRRALDVAAKSTDLDLEMWHQQVGGDGELAVLPEDADMPQLVGEFPNKLGAALAEINDGWPLRPRLRVRVAIHYGTLSWAPFGPAGDAPIQAARLLDARTFKQFLAERQDLDLALVVSDSVYRDVVRTGFCVLDRTLFRQIRMRAKGASYRGHIYCPPVADNSESLAE